MSSVRKVISLVFWLLVSSAAHAVCISDASEIPENYVVTHVVGFSSVTAPMNCDSDASRFAIGPLNVRLRRAFNGLVCLTFDAQPPAGYRIAPGHRPRENQSCGCRRKTNYSGRIECVESYKAVVIRKRKRKRE